MIHIYAPEPEAVTIRRMDCPTCKRSRFGVQRITPWIGSDLICLRCGEMWNDEGRAERPFERAWRKRHIDCARKWAKRYKATFGKPIRWIAEP